MDPKYPKYHLLHDGHIDVCQICGSKNLKKILDLGHQPLCNTLLTEDMLQQPETVYPLCMVWCEVCTNAQINYYVDKNKIYHLGYPYKTGATTEVVGYFEDFSKSLISNYQLNSAKLIVDIGSNDGTFLENFQKNNISVVGVEPTNTALLANAKGVKTLQSFFTTEIVNTIRAEHGKADLIVAANVFERINNIGEVMSGIENLLQDDGVFVLEFHSLLAIISGGQFDALYHEHLRIFSVQSLKKLLSYYNLSLVDAEYGFTSRHNMRVYIMKGKNIPCTKSVESFLEKEKDFNLDKLETYVSFADRAKKTKKDFVNGIAKIIDSNKKIVANSCPARLIIPLNYFGIDTDKINYIVENPLSPKVGMYLPINLIPVMSNEILAKDQPDFILILAYNYADNIVKNLKSKGLHSDFIIPLPDFKIIKNEDISI
jgi:hypothetical protein